MYDKYLVTGATGFLVEHAEKIGIGSRAYELIVMK